MFFRYKRNPPSSGFTLFTFVRFGPILFHDLTHVVFVYSVTDLSLTPLIRPVQWSPTSLSRLEDILNPDFLLRTSSLPFWLFVFLFCFSFEKLTSITFEDTIVNKKVCGSQMIVDNGV